MTEAELSQLKTLDLDRLSLGLPGVTPALGRSHVEACMARMHDQRKFSGHALMLTGDLGNEVYNLFWQDTVNQQLLNSYNDDEVTTESAAYAIAFILVINLTEYTIVRKSKKGTGFDYWLGKADDEFDIFGDSARLEVSGIRRANGDAEFERRVREKVVQTQPTDGYGLPAYIAVTDFGALRTRVVIK